ncbi:Core-2/I-Branching enzyme [Musa troglodytarum]|uniref:Core-2/I-Branching enzyme n=1 Tax=Musa troglodytarum TaxID=320322 RepID=A0A9E7JRQ9_9LILI|nr:Core-2/I-Branching enzyme [Musa troglodytarum]
MAASVARGADGVPEEIPAPPPTVTAFLFRSPPVALRTADQRRLPLEGQRPASLPVLVWGDLSMVDAERRLLVNALLDISNQRFALLSDTCIPLFDFTYRYLMRSKYILKSQLLNILKSAS